MWCEQGATFQLPLVWRDTNGSPIDLTGYTARMEVRKNKTSGTVLVTLTTENGRITLGGTNGKIDLEIEAATTEEFTAGIYMYDLNLMIADKVYRLMEGTFTVSGEVTQ